MPLARAHPVTETRPRLESRGAAERRGGARGAFSLATIDAVFSGCGMATTPERLPALGAIEAFRAPAPAPAHAEIGGEASEAFLGKVDDVFGRR